MKVKGLVRPFKQAERSADIEYIHPPKHHGRLAILLSREPAVFLLAFAGAVVS